MKVLAFSSRPYEREFSGRRARVIYYLGDSELQITLTPPDMNAIIQPLKMSEDPEMIYRALSDRALGSARTFLSQPAVHNWITETYAEFLKDYRGRTEQNKPQE